MNSLGIPASGRRRGSSRWTRGLLVCAAAMLAWARPAAAQAADAASDPRAAGEGRACFSGRPSPACRSFWITEFGGAWYSVTPRGDYNLGDREIMFLWELGWMRNRSARDAMGASVFFATNDEVMRTGVRGRYRRWVADGLAVDVAPTLIVLQSNRAYEVRAQPGVSVLGDVSFGDWIVLTGELEATAGGVRGLYGVRLGTYGGVVSALSFPLAVAAILGSDKS